MLELGSGTGLLAVLLSPLCAEYTATDLLENLKLVERNLELNGSHNPDRVSSSSGPALKSPDGPSRSTVKRSRSSQRTEATAIKLEEIDWVAISSNRIRAKGSSSLTPSHPTAAGEAYDLILAVDCIYNEHLIQPLVDTLTYYCPMGSNITVWIVVELRSPDVVSSPFRLCSC